jgi:hypothetical protein
MKPDSNRPPLYTVWEDFTGWTMDRTAGIPKSQRFTFGQRIDGKTLDVLALIVRAIHVRDRASLLGRRRRDRLFAHGPLPIWEVGDAGGNHGPYPDAYPTRFDRLIGRLASGNGAPCRA